MGPKGSKPWEIEQVTAIFRRQDPRAVYLEIGANEGRSLIRFGRCMEKPATLIGVDTRVCRPELGAACAELERDGYDVRLITGDSRAYVTVRRVEAILGSRQVDVLFIDGDHRLASAAQDAVNYIPMVREGGVFCFHDCSPMIPATMKHDDIRFCQGIQAIWRDACYGRRAMLIAEYAGYGLGWK